MEDVMEDVMVAGVAGRTLYTLCSQIEIEPTLDDRIEVLLLRPLVGRDA